MAGQSEVSFFQNSQSLISKSGIFLTCAQLSRNTQPPVQVATGQAEETLGCGRIFHKYAGFMKNIMCACIENCESIEERWYAGLARELKVAKKK